jgi:hypothetical protein
MKRSSRLRNTANLSESIHQQLSMYAIAASAAGVGLLAISQPAEGKIVYTPSNVKLLGRTFLDLNHDGIAEFKITNTYFVRHYNCGKDLRISYVAISNRILDQSNGVETKSNWARALPKGAKIGGSQKFVDGAAMAYRTMGSVETKFSQCVFVSKDRGNWVDVERRYLGLKFLIHGRTHYGWARLNVHLLSEGGIAATLTGYAYETIPNKGIITGATKGPDDAEPTASLNTPTLEPATLGALAMGAPGLEIWRRKESVGAIASSS